MSDCIDFAAMLTEVGGWDTPLPFGLECATTILEDGLHFAQIDDEQTNITSTTSSESSEEQIGVQYNETSESKGQVNEEPVKTFEEVMQQVWTESNEPKVVSQTGQEETVRVDSQETGSQEQAEQDHAQQKGFFNKWVIGKFVLGTAAVVGVVFYIFKRQG